MWGLSRKRYKVDGTPRKRWAKKLRRRERNMIVIDANTGKIVNRDATKPSGE